MGLRSVSFKIDHQNFLTKKVFATHFPYLRPFITSDILLLLHKSNTPHSVSRQYRASANNSDASTPSSKKHTALAHPKLNLGSPTALATIIQRMHPISSKQKKSLCHLSFYLDNTDLIESFNFKLC